MANSTSNLTHYGTGERHSVKTGLLTPGPAVGPVGNKAAQSKAITRQLNKVANKAMAARRKRNLGR